MSAQEPEQGRRREELRYHDLGGRITERTEAEGRPDSDSDSDSDSNPDTTPARVTAAALGQRPCADLRSVRAAADLCNGAEQWPDTHSELRTRRPDGSRITVLLPTTARRRRRIPPLDCSDPDSADTRVLGEVTSESKCQ